jgi:actin-related protein 9
LGQALQARLSTFILSSAGENNEVQARAVGVIKVPEYFAEYREVGAGYAAFLGASVVAKVITHATLRVLYSWLIFGAQISFNDAQSKNFVSKADYAAQGPRAIIQMSPALL